MLSPDWGRNFTLLDKFKSHIVGEPSMIDTSMNDICTPDPIYSKYLDCQIVGNKWQSFVEDELNHSKWEEFRRLAKMDSSHEECSQLLRKIELQNSEGDMEDQDLCSLEDATLEEDDAQSKANVFEVQQDKKKKKRKP